MDDTIYNLGITGFAFEPIQPEFQKWFQPFDDDILKIL
jgi:hypothetical protein